MKLHKESKGTLWLSSILFGTICFLSIYFLEIWGL
ncbi:MAG TPA: phosphatidylserine decarboxylase family protein, partial [Chryseobacterium sp.]|nr:phosphatidylserine decarboxylase family protein [Chryseobacterium sp.]